MVDLTQFANNLDSYAKNLEINSDRLIRNVTISIIQNLVTTTPIDIGTAVSNWQVGLAGSSNGFIAAREPGVHGSTAQPNRSMTISDAKSTLKSYKFGTSLSIYNDTPYLARLNQGSSSQAPAGFVEEAFLRGIEQTKQVPDLLTRLMDEL